MSEVSTEKQKNKGGRPTKYDPSMCEEVIKCGEQGFSNAEMAAHLGIAKSVLYAYEAENEEFSNALQYARTLSQVWWEKKGRNCLDNQHFQSAVYNKAMPARFPDDYREKKDLALSGSIIQVVSGVPNKIGASKDD